jgi:PPK2 family polyphosphate:nucleotide phosphotransferase
MYAHDKHAFLLIFQGMDTGGKDGAIKHVMSGINPSGVSVASFKKPSELDLEHDWMWRCQSHFPERGRIAIFNRSYYEEVLVVKVHPEILKKGQRIPSEHLGDLDEVWKQRYSDIRNLEDYLHRNGTQVVKFFFHLGKEEQKSRLLERINEPEKNWKMSIQDVAERQHWDAYMDAYHDALTATHTSNSPWYVVPADDKKNARLIVSSILLNHIRKLKMDYPEVSPEFRKEMQEAKRMLESE